MLDLKSKKRLVDYHIAMRRTKLTTADGYDLAFVPAEIPPPSAQWRYDNHRKRHNIIINNALDEIMDRPDLKPWEKLLCCYRVYDHEGGHSLYTERDNVKLKELAKKWKIPFHLWNVFEDARIEQKWRLEFRSRFNWERFFLYADEEPPSLREPGEPMNAIALFLDCIHMENSYLKARKWLAADKDPKILYRGKGKKAYGRRYLVHWFYKKAISSYGTEALPMWISYWLETFPETRGMEICIGEIHGGDLTFEPGSGEMPGEAQDADGSEHKEIPETIKPFSGTGGGPKGSPTKKVAETSEEYHHKGESKVIEPMVLPSYPYFFASDRQRTVDFAKADRLIRLFEKFLEGGEGTISSRAPSGKIDFRKFMRGADDIYIRKGEDPYGVKSISFIMDASGSMARACEEGVYLAYVLNELTKRRKIECKQMILSGGPNFSVPMPFDPRILNHLITPGGTEGFVRAMKEHEKELVQTDMTIFFTDGNITDEHIVKEHWHRRGVYTVGLFTGDPSRSSQLHQWFDSVLVRNDIEAVADSLVQIIKRV